jgi:hypothetical protein
VTTELGNIFTQFGYLTSSNTTMIVGSAPVLHLGAHLRLDPVLRPLHFVDVAFISTASLGTVLRSRCIFPKSPRSPAIRLVAPHLGLFPVQ